MARPFSHKQHSILMEALNSFIEQCNDQKKLSLAIQTRAVLKRLR